MKSLILLVPPSTPPTTPSKIEILLRAFEENVRQEAFLVEQNAFEELAALLEQQEPIVRALVEHLGICQAEESAEMQAWRQRLAQAYQQREETANLVQKKYGPLRAEIAQIRQTNLSLQNWKKVWAAPDLDVPTARMPTSYA